MIMYTVAEDHMGDNEIAQVIAFICGVIVIILMIMGLASSDWLMALGWRQGLFAHCIEDNAPTPLPFNMPDPPGCYQARDAGYIKAAAALCVVCLIADIAATLLTGLGLRAKDHRDKHKCYRVAVFCMGIALVSLLTALVIYPVFFAAELNLANGNRFEGNFSRGKKEGRGIFYHIKTGQLQEGSWLNDTCIVSTMENTYWRQSAAEPTQYPIPKVKVKNFDEIIESQINHAFLVWNRKASSSLTNYQDYGLGNIDCL